MWFRYEEIFLTNSGVTDSWQNAGIAYVPNGAMLVAGDAFHVLNSKRSVQQGQTAKKWILETSLFHPFERLSGRPETLKDIVDGTAFTYSKVRTHQCEVEAVDRDAEAFHCRGTHKALSVEVPFSFLTPFAQKIVAAYDVTDAAVRVLVDDSDVRRPALRCCGYSALHPSKC